MDCENVVDEVEKGADKCDGVWIRHEQENEC